MQRYIRLATAFVLAIGALLPVTMPSQAGEFMCANETESGMVVVCGLTADFAHGLPLVDHTDFPKGSAPPCDAKCIANNAKFAAKLYLLQAKEKAIENRPAKH